MYLSHFELKEKPFKISTDPRFLWLGEKHKEALATLLYGILYNDGFVVVTGDVGTGKTTLASALMTELAGKVIAVKVPFPDFESLDFFKWISAAYGIDEGFESKGSFFSLFESFLRKSASAGKKVVLILDEAQRLTPEHLKELLHLSNIEENGARLLNVVFVGQNEFNDILLAEANRALRQRITINYNLCALSKEETGQYIAHRLLVAQGKEEIFAPEAIEEVFSFSGGIPRLINVVCDLALLLTYFGGEKIVQAKTTKESALRLRLPSEKPGDKGNEPQVVSGGEEAIQIEIEGKEREGEEPERKNGGRRRRFWGKVLFGGGVAVLALGMGWFFLGPNRDGPPREENLKESKSGTGPKEIPPQKETEKSREKDSRDPASPATKESALLTEAVKSPEPPRSQPEVRVSAPGKTDKEPKIQPGTPGKKEGNVPKKIPVLGGQAAAGPLRGKEDSRRTEKPPGDREKAISGEEKENAGGGPPPPSSGEPASRGAEDVDPNKVIEWLIERRSEKK